MREIKFRAYRKDEKIMMKFSLFNPLEFPSTPWVYWEVMQYTGIKDCNKKEIYEGDIVAYPSTKFKGEVIFSTLGGVKYCIWEGGKGNKSGSIIELHVTSDLEVLGNVFETPELIK